MKALRKKYGKTPWMNTPFSQPYKRRLALASVQAAGVLAQSIVCVSQIGHAAGVPQAYRAIAMAKAKACTEAMRSVKKILEDVKK